MSQPNILAISGSLREGSLNTSILKSLASLVEDKAKVTVQRLNDVPVYNQDVEVAGLPKGVADLGEAVRAADGLIISTPEYNHSAPGVLINALDWLSRPHGNSAYAGKSVWIISASPGGTGGVRAHEALLPNLIANDCRVMGGAQVVIQNAADKITNGDLTDESTINFLLAQFDRFLTKI